MKTAKVNMYYCDFCKKKSQSASSMRKHEKHCTANPQRQCRLCRTKRNISDFITNLKSRFEIAYEVDTLLGSDIRKVKWLGEPVTLKEITDFTRGCPNCTLAVLRQTKLNYSVFGFKYDYKQELNNWWYEVNQDIYEPEYGYF